MPVLEFPNVKPQFLRTIQTPDYTLSSFVTKSGYENVIRKGFQGYSTQLTLEYKHITQSDAVAVINFFNQVKGTAIAFKLPDDFLNVQTAVTDSIANLGSTQRWKFLNEPTLTLLVASPEVGRYNWTIQLRAVYGESTGIDDEIVTTDPDPIAVSDAPIITPVPETVTDANNVIVIPITNVNNPVETPDTTNVITRLLRTKITLNIPESIAVSGSLNKTLDFCKSFVLYRVDCSQKIRLRLYANETYRTADLSRLITTRPSANSGLIYEGIRSLDATPTSIFLEPVAIAYNLDDTNAPYGISIANVGATSVSNFTIDFYIIPLEV